MNTHSDPLAHQHEKDDNLVEFWLKKNPTRWLAGAAAGMFSGVVTLAFAAVLSVALGKGDPWFPVKLMASIPAGAEATEFGFNVPMLIIGFVFFEVLMSIIGVAFAHFVFTNSLSALLGMGLVWGTFAWVFIWNLYLPSFPTFRAAQIPSGPALFICIVMGISLTAVAFFDRALRGNR
jgi:hypothetical protein